jgi:hypothetical protein
MLLMYDHSESFPPLDVCLLLRTHAEQLWLSRETIPVLYQLQTPGGLPEEQLGAALAYLEASWLEALRLAQETEAAYAELEAAVPRSDLPLPLQARRYHAAVRRLREAVAERIDAVIAAPGASPRRSTASPIAG